MSSTPLKGHSLVCTRLKILFTHEADSIQPAKNIHPGAEETTIQGEITEELLASIKSKKEI